jgi:hypothetical protein
MKLTERVNDGWGEKSLSRFLCVMPNTWRAKPGTKKYLPTDEYKS